MNTASAYFLANIPSPDRGVWQIGPLSLRAYALCIIAGIVLAIWLGERRWVQRGGTKGTIIDIAVFAVPFGLVGGRLYHVITDNQLYFGEGKDPIRALYVWEGGLGIWGAIALGAVGAWIACRRKGIPLPAVADAVAPGIVIAQAIGRLGNYFNQELYGGPTDLPWGLEIYQRVDPATGLPDALNGVAVTDVPLAVVHPTFLYELLWNLGVALLVLWADRRFRLGHGRAFALYVAGYTAGRFWIELMRTDQANHILGLRVNVWTSVLVFAGAVAYLVIARRFGPRERPEDLATGPDDGGAAGDGDGADGADSAEDTGAGADTDTTDRADGSGTEDTGGTGPDRRGGSGGGGTASTEVG
ncbi:prolipoprotein diacylglyceryl transferase [Saccharomonospora cyanea]|uniref:prolipoprotein diacylglyceryl transferase n=1 Tax=Saccharomonospora cyanea TaxID=40989 RepID=UPI0005B7E8DA|nr:prolipoprotein diacylglyceryl transferase [Saccharomonospora cyanea]